ncbi:MAG: hypothetical protein JWL83_2342 [Actinomycetia bacterium]|nr:hypothetical protein [Actinomycetes bacterium]
MTESCREWRGDLAAFAIDRLEPNQRLALQAHLDGCADCRTELAGLRAVAKALPEADGSHLEAPSDPPAALGDKILGVLAWERAGEHKRRRRHLSVVVGTAVAAVAAAIGLLVLGASLHATDHNARHVAFSVEPRGVAASAVLHRREYGTNVSLKVAGLHEGGEWYWLWLTGDNGKRVGAGSFQANGGEASVQMTSALPLSATRRVWVTDDKNRVVLDTGWAPELAPRPAS